MQIQLLSDLHLEFHADAGASFVERLDPTGIDVLVLAGDITVGKAIPAALDLFCRLYKDAHVLYIHGNHEFYGANRESIYEWTRQAVAANPNLHWLDHEVIEIDGQRFLGAPLWFPEDPSVAHHKSKMNDFQVIEDFESWVYADNARAVALFHEELRSDDIAITHHLPVRASIAPRFVDHPLTPFFLTDLEQLIRERKPRYWLHGHSHESADADVGDTAILSNPFGYFPDDLNREFRYRFVTSVS